MIRGNREQTAHAPLRDRPRAQRAVADLAVRSLLGTGGAPVEDAYQVIHHQFADETPVPADLWPTLLWHVATGQDLVDPLQEFVVTAGRLQQKLAFLPIDDADEKLVEDYIRVHAASRPGRRLLRTVARPLPDDTR